MYVLITHYDDDGLTVTDYYGPFTNGDEAHAYIEALRGEGRKVDYWDIESMGSPSIPYTVRK